MPATYNIKTDFGAVGNGIANDAQKFADFNAAAILVSGLVTLTIPAGTYSFASTVAQHWTSGISQLLVLGAGAGSTSLKNDVGSDQTYFFGGSGVVQNNSHSARLTTVNSGASTLTLLSAGDASLFTVGRYALITGYDLQGIWATPYGYPQNPLYFEYVKITGISGTSITIEAPLRNTYLSTWPNWNSGSAFEIDNGGPATLYALPSSWNTEAEYRDFIIDNPNFQTYANGRLITFRNVIVTGNLGLVPSQNDTYSLIGCDLPTCTMEVDKLISTFNVDSTTIYRMDFQSASVNVLNITNGTAITDKLTGTAKITNVNSGCSIGTLRAGATGYGYSSQLNCDGASITTFETPGGALDQGISGINDSWRMVEDTIIIPNGSLITNAIVSPANSPWIRLTVNSSAGFTTGKYVGVANVGGTTEANGDWVVIVIDGTHVELQDSTFTHAYTSGGRVQSISSSSDNPMRTLGHGGQFVWVCQTESAGPSVRVKEVTQDATNTYVRLNRTYSGGGFPPTGSDLAIRSHPAPLARFTNCTGSHYVVDFSQAGAFNKPLYSYSLRSYVGADLIGSVTPGPYIWGTPTRIVVTVGTAYAGASSLSLNLFGQGHARGLDGPDYATLTSWNPSVNLKIAGTRTYTLAGGWTGAQSGDSLSSPGDVWLSENQPAFSSRNISAEGSSVTVSIEITTDQGLERMITPLGLRLRS